MLAVARIAGETAPLLFTAFNNRYLSASLDRPIASLPVQILTYATSPYKDWQDQAWTGALVLVTLVFVLNLSARVAAWRATFRRHLPAPPAPGDAAPGPDDDDSSSTSAA
jgi:phosphate transport system permease protein